MEFLEFIPGFVVVGGALLALIVKNNVQFEFMNACLVVAVFFGTGLTIDGTNKKSNKEYAKEVSLGQVTMQGKNSFRAQIQITYEDGKLESVMLVPKSTTPEATTK